MRVANYELGRGNWREYRSDLSDILAYAEQWRQQLQNVQRPWLCWNVHPDWCLIQQKLVQSVGWTPVIGSDPRAAAPQRIDGAIEIDFNRGFRFPNLFPHFVLEFAFAFCDRLAFWHSDLLLRAERMSEFAELFERLDQGQMAAVVAKGGIRNSLRPKRHRYWELLGCTTGQASLDQFNKGCGWWKHFALHPNCPSEAERSKRESYRYEYGTGIMYWKVRYGGRVVDIDNALVKEGHCTRINNANYKIVSEPGAARDLSRDLPANFELQEVCDRLGLSELYLQK